MTVVEPTLARLLVHRLRVERKEVREDSAGGQAVRWIVVGEGYGRVSQPATATPAEERPALSLHERAPYYIYVSPDLEVQRGDVIVVDDRRRLYVHAVQWPSVEIYHRVETNEYQEEIPRRAPLGGEEW